MVLILLVIALVSTDTWFKGSYQKTNIVLRWFLFLPLSIARAGLISIVLMLNNVYVNPINKHLAIFINWVVVPIFLFYTISITIPKGKKAFPLIVCFSWIFFGILELVTDPNINIVMRIIQTVVLVIFSVVWIRIPKEDFYKIEVQ